MLDELITFIKLILSATETPHFYDWRAVFEVLLILHTKLWSWRHLKEKSYVWKPKYFKYSSLLKEYSEFYNFFKNISNTFFGKPTATGEKYTTF